MTAKELAEILLKNPDDIVAVSSSNFEQNYAWKELGREGAHFRFKGEIKEETFRDAFDGETYKSRVVEVNNDSKQWFIKL